MASAEKRSQLQKRGRKGGENSESTEATEPTTEQSTDEGKATATKGEAKAKEPKPPKPVESKEDMLERLKNAEATPAHIRERFSIVEEILEVGKNGPTRVRIRCSDPQTKQDPSDATKQISVCEGTREIAVQDLFQVRRCKACQDRVIRKNRRETQKTKNKALRAAAKKST
jgi:hypothetical protein